MFSDLIPFHFTQSVTGKGQELQAFAGTFAVKWQRNWQLQLCVTQTIALLMRIINLPLLHSDHEAYRRAHWNILNGIFVLPHRLRQNERRGRDIMKLLSRTRASFCFRMAWWSQCSNSITRILLSCRVIQMFVKQQHSHLAFFFYAYAFWMKGMSLFPTHTLMCLLQRSMCFPLVCPFKCDSTLTSSRLGTASSVSVEPLLKAWPTHRLSLCSRTPQAPYSCRSRSAREHTHTSLFEWDKPADTIY